MSRIMYASLPGQIFVDGIKKIRFFWCYCTVFIDTQRVINVWNSLPMSVEFGSLSAFTQSIGRVNLNQFLAVYKFSLAC